MRRGVVVALTTVVVGAGAATAVPSLHASGARAQKDPPTLSPIHANFDPEAKATFYNVVLTYPKSATNMGDPTYAWTLAPPPDDAGCKRFQPSASDPSRAVWFHSEDDGCSHKTPQHNGTVTVKVTVRLSNDPRPWTCSVQYFGTLTGDGPAPGPCTIEAPALVAVARPKTDDKEKWALAAQIYDACEDTEAAMAGSIGAAAFLAPPLAGPAAVAGSFAVICHVLKKRAEGRAADPPDRNFRPIAAPTGPRPLHFTAGNGISAQLAGALNALAANAAQSAGLGDAFLTSINRASGAHAAGDAAAQAAQQRAAAGYARRLARLNAARRILWAQALAAARAAGLSATVTPAQLARAQKQSGSGLPSTVTRLLRKAGASAGDLAAVGASFRSAKAAAPLGFPAALPTAGLARADAADAAALQSYAAALTR